MERSPGGGHDNSPQYSRLEKWSEVAQSCLTLCDPMDCSPPGSSIRGIFQARVLEWVAISFSRDLPLPGIKAGSPTLLANTFTIWATRETWQAIVHRVAESQTWLKQLCTHSRVCFWHQGNIDLLEWVPSFSIFRNILWWIFISPLNIWQCSPMKSLDYCCEKKFITESIFVRSLCRFSISTWVSLSSLCLFFGHFV